MEHSRNDFVGKTQGYVTLGIDPLIGKNLWDNVAVSSPCIGPYKLTCLPKRFSSSRLRALSLALPNPSSFYLLVDLLGDSLVCNRLRCAPAWAVLGYSFVGCVVILPCGCIAFSFVAALYCSLVGCIILLLRGCIVFLPCGLLLHCPSWLYCVVILWTRSRAVRFSW